MKILKTIEFKLDLPLVKYLREGRVDILIVMGLAIAIAISTYLGTNAIPSPIFTDFYAQDVWFGSDIPTVFGNITSLNSDFGRNNKHPLFPLVVFPLVFGVGKLFHLDPLSAVRVVVVGVAVLWICSLYTLFRLMGCYRLDATLFSLLGGVSAASVFWLVIPESFPLGSVTIILGLAVVAFAQTHPLASGWYVVVNIMTVSITITNWMVGLLATFVSHRWQQALKIIITALLLTTGLWVLQRIVFTNTGFPFQPGTFIGEKKFVSAPAPGGILATMSAFFYQTMVMPATQFLAAPIRPDWVKLTVDNLAPGSGSRWGQIAMMSWTALLGLGVWGFLATKQHHKLRIVLGLTLIAQIGMHGIYGVGETFLYSLHFLPLLLTLAAFGLFTRLRPLSLILATILIVSAGINNRAQFRTISATLGNYGTPQQQVEAQMKLRPADPWPRSVGRVVLAAPGSAAEQRAFHQPGGSFSPQSGSFGVSIWVVDRQGKIETTSDLLPLGEIQQQFTDLDGSNTPKILTKTKYYETSWSMPTAGKWQLSLKSLASNDRRIVASIRSVGPAGGAIPSLDWNGQRLLISDRWIVKDLPQQAKVYLGSENTVGWSRDRSPQTHWVDPNGWGYARIELNPGESGVLLFEDTQPTPAPTLQSTGAIDLALNLPDSQFVDSLKAQIAHLKMGLVGTRTHPSDPIGYPLPRFRDGAYQMVALARAGQLDVAQQLSSYFAENDFINSTLPEADIPAVGIWALAEVARAIAKPDYDRWLWPHVQRKAELIGAMLSSHRPGYPVFEGAKFPFAEYPDLIRVDLSAGKMTKTPGAISINPAASAIGYRALLDAATLADRLQQSDRAQQWRSQAAQLKTTWQTANQTEFSAVTNGLRSSGIADSHRARMAQTLQQRWETSRHATGAFRVTSQPLHANIAEAHQWVLLDRADRLWPKLKWFWQQQASPGLYTWAGDRDEPGEIPQPQSFSQWDRWRGSIDSSHLTPHYWTSAEMLLLQLDLLAYIDRTTSSPVLVIGAGMPPAWPSQPMSVTGRSVEGNLVNWAWDGQQMNVQIKGEKMPIELGAAFPPTAPVNVVMLPASP